MTTIDRARFEAGLTYERYKDQMTRNRDRVEANEGRVELDERSESVGRKIREAELRKVPYMLVVGAREAENGTVSLRHRTGDDLGAVPLDRVLADLAREIGSRDVSLAVGRS